MALSSQTIIDKNSESTDAVFLVLVEIIIPDTPIVRIVSNTENISWGGYTWINFPFEFADVSENTTGEVSQYQIKISNVNRTIERYLQTYDLYLKQNGIDGNEIECIIRVVNSNDLLNPEPVSEYRSLLEQPTSNAQWATFKLSSKNPFQKQFPPRTIRKNFCSFKFKSAECGYTGSATTCDNTLVTCRSYNNSHRFGGFPGVEGRGIIVV